MKKYTAPLADQTSMATELPFMDSSEIPLSGTTDSFDTRGQYDWVDEWDEDTNE